VVDTGYTCPQPFFYMAYTRIRGVSSNFQIFKFSNQF
jgi:hypothetical protein